MNKVFSEVALQCIYHNKIEVFHCILNGYPDAKVSFDNYIVERDDGEMDTINYRGAIISAMSNSSNVSLVSDVIKLLPLEGDDLQTVKDAIVCDHLEKGDVSFYEGLGLSDFAEVKYLTNTIREWYFYAERMSDKKKALLVYCFANFHVNDEIKGLLAPYASFPELGNQEKEEMNKTITHVITDACSNLNYHVPMTGVVGDHVDHVDQVVDVDHH